MSFSAQAGQVIFRTQAVQGTYQADITTAGTVMKLRSGGLGINRDLLITDPEIGGGRDISDAYLGAASWEGQYEWYARMEALPTLFKAAMGTAGVVTTTGVTVDTITPLDSSTLPFLSIEETVGSSLETFNYTDGVVNTLHLEAEANGYLMGNCGIISAKQTAGNTKTASPAFTDVSPLIVGTNITLTYNAVAIPAKSFSMDFTNNFENNDFRLGSFFLGDLGAKRRELTFGAKIRHQSSALMRQAAYGTSGATGVGGLTTKQQLVITMSTYEDIISGIPATKGSLTITIPNVILKPFAFEPNQDDIIENDVEFQALRPSVGTPLATFVFKSARAAIA